MKLRLKLPNSSRQRKSQSQSKRSRGLLRHSGLRTYLGFLGLAFGFWFLQSMQKDVVRRIHIPLAYDTLRADRGLSDRLPDYLELEVQDKGIEHIRYALGDIDTIRLGLLEGKNGREFVGITAKELSQAINQRLSASAQVLQQSIHEVRVALYNRVSKRLPIVLDRSIRVANGFTVTGFTLYPDSITVYGERNTLERIEAIQTRPLLLSTPPRESVVQSVPLLLPPGVYADLSEVTVSIDVEELTEQAFTLPISVLNQPAGYKLTPLPSTATVTLTIPRSQYGELSAADITIGVDYLDAAKYTGVDVSGAAHQLEIKFIKQPDKVVGVRIAPSTIQYALEAL